jgi:CrcB protein
LTIDRQELLTIFTGKAAGALLRAGLVELFPAHGGDWPSATFGVNAAGCLLLGYFATRLQERLPLSAYRRPLLGTGLCGALTTFSTFQLEIFRMLQHDHPARALGYAAASLGAGLFAIALATSAVRRARLA